MNVTYDPKADAMYINMTIKTQQAIEEIVREVVTKYQPEKIILFGSAARGEMTPDSDLDFFIIKRDVPHRGIDRHYDLVKRIHYCFASDFLICTPREVETRVALGDPFVTQILAEGKVLYG
jgi:predicted nucleotidyltransferase